MCRGPPNRPTRLFLRLSQPRLIPQRRVRYEDQVPVLNQFIRFRLLRTPSPDRTAYERTARAMLDSPRRQGVKPLRQFALLVSVQRYQRMAPMIFEKSSVQGAGSVSVFATRQRFSERRNSRSESDAAMAIHSDAVAPAATSAGEGWKI